MGENLQEILRMPQRYIERKKNLDLFGAGMNEMSVHLVPCSKIYTNK